MDKNISFRCFYPNGNKTDHKMTMKLSEVKKWIDAYFFTHPECEAITVKIWKDS